MRNYLSIFLVLMFLLAVSACESNKVSCPTYANSFPDKKKKQEKPGAQQPLKKHYGKPKSGIVVGGPKHKGKVD